MTIEEKVGQLFFIGIAGPQLDIPTRELIGQIRPGGVCLFARNIRESQQTRDLLDEIRRMLPNKPFLSLDQEGGLVDRLRRVLSPMPAPAKLRSAEDAEKLAGMIAEATRILGFNMDFAPVVDVIDGNRAGSSNGIQTRNFGASKEDVAIFASAFLASLEANGILGCLKHFPGLGASTVDSHEELPQVLVGGDEFGLVDLYPYKQILGQSDRVSVMVAHAGYPNLNLQEADQNGKLLPSSLSSSVVNGLLRNTLGFDGLTITDDLEMGAIVNNYGIGDACKMAIAAGVDMLAICASADAVREGFGAMVAAVETGEIAESRIDESLERVGRYRAFLKPPKEFDQMKLDRISDEVASFNNELE